MKKTLIGAALVVALAFTASPALADEQLIPVAPGITVLEDDCTYVLAENIGQTYTETETWDGAIIDVVANEGYELLVQDDSGFYANEDGSATRVVIYENEACWNPEVVEETPPPVVDEMDTLPATGVSESQRVSLVATAWLAGAIIVAGTFTLLLRLRSRKQ